MKRPVLLLLSLAACSIFSLSTPAQIEFTGTVKSIEKESDQVAVLMVSLTSTFDIPVRITGMTEIRDENGEPMTLSEIKVDMTLEIEGLFLEKGILAREVKVAKKATDFELKGRIENIDGLNREIKVLGFVIQVPETAEIKDSEGDPLLFSGLQLNQFVEVEGNVSESRLVASEVKVIRPEAKKARVRLEGIVVSMEESTLQVLVEAVGPALVRITPETDIHGTLAVGVLVRVIGTINEDLSVAARKIIVRSIVQLAPHRLKMGTNKTRRVEVILRKTFDQDVELAVTSLNPDLAKASVSSLTIPAGKVTGSFQVTSGPTSGETTIEVQLPADLGGFKAVLPVEVSQANDHEGKELEVEWRPDEVNMRTNEERKVQLRLSKPAPSELAVQISVKDGEADLVEFPAQVTFGAGSIRVEVTLKSKSSRGEVKLRARLPESVGGDADDLEIEVK